MIPIWNKIKGQATNIAYQINDALDAFSNVISKLLPKDGSEPLTGSLDVNSKDINNVYNLRFVDGGNIINVNTINGIDISAQGGLSEVVAGLPYRTQLTLTREFVVGDDYGCVVPERYVISESGELTIEGSGVFMVVGGTLI